MIRPDLAAFRDATPLPPPAPPAITRHFPTLFLSDLHLGSRACRDQDLLTFLQAHTADIIYLVGDIVDTWTAASVTWSANQHAIVQLLLARASTGTRLIYTPGNHDALFRRYCGQQFAGIEIVPHAFHHARDGRRYLVVHGDVCDVFGSRYPWLERLGSKAENLIRTMGQHVNRLRRYFGRQDWTLVDRVLSIANDLIRSVDEFDRRLSDFARQHGADGIICGHFHQPALHADHGVTYANCGDWVENTTALAETASGRLVLLDWTARATDKRSSAPRMLGAAATGI